MANYLLRILKYYFLLSSIFKGECIRFVIFFVKLIGYYLPEGDGTPCKDAGPSHVIRVPPTLLVKQYGNEPLKNK